MRMRPATSSPVLRQASRSLVAIAAMLLLVLAAGCVHRFQYGPALEATATATVNTQAAVPEDARRDAIKQADTLARDQILRQAGQMRLADGRTLEDLAVADPFVRAKLQDTVRAARVSSRVISDEGVVTLTVRMDLKPINQLIASHSGPAPK